VAQSLRQSDAANERRPAVRARAPVESVWLATPDDGLGRPRKLSFEQDEAGIMFIVPRLDFWDLVVLEPAHPSPENSE